MTPLGRLPLASLAAGLVIGCGSGATEAERVAEDRKPRHETVELVEIASRGPGPAGGTESETAGPRPDERPAAEQIFRRDDSRPRHDEDALARVGIRRYPARRLVLYSDLPAEKAGRLPALVDAAYEEWVAYFGELPPARDGSDYQLTGYLIRDLDLFRSAGLVPDGVTFEHGQHRGQEFWLRDQYYDEYREHLLIHEATHCFMTALPGSEAGPIWYMEGMAERFGTHRTGADGRIEFRTMPELLEERAGFGRITMVRDEIVAGRFKSLAEVFAIRPEHFSSTATYAWSWALCTFLDSHPRYRERFRGLGDPRRRAQFVDEFRTRFSADLDDLALEWAAFAHTIRAGYDIEHAAVGFGPGRDLSAGEDATVTVAADRGWQSSGLRVAAGKSYEVVATGRFTLAGEPKPWVCEADGITFDYFDGRPLGRLTAAVLADPPRDGADAAGGLLSPIDVGRRKQMLAPYDGMLYFRVNDGWDRLVDNEGELSATVRAVDEE